MGSILKGRNNTHKVRNFQEFEAERKITVCFGLETIIYRSPQLWSLLPEHMRQLNSTDQFKRSVRHWVCNTCPCTFCKVYLQNVGFYKSSMKSLLGKKFRIKCLSVESLKNSSGVFLQLVLIAVCFFSMFPLSLVLSVF